MRWIAKLAIAGLACACAFDETGRPGNSDGQVAPIDAASFDAAGVDARPAIDGTSTPDSVTIDAIPPADGAADASNCPSWDWSPTNFDPCDPLLPAAGPPFAPDSDGTWTINTDDATVSPPTGPNFIIPSALLAQPSGPTLRVIPVTGFGIGVNTTVEVVGSHPLVFAVYGEATLSGTLDVSARTPLEGEAPGPGADLLCEAATAGENASDGSSGAGGGGGGGYGKDGGDGGDGHGPGKGDKGDKGDDSGDPEISPLRGGCSGGHGGSAFDATAGVGGAGGAGGGAIQISARDSLTVSGEVRSAGNGGRSGQAGLLGAHSGAGGGGSGGAILLESDKVTLAEIAAACANGGSGGEGADANIAGAQGVAGTCSAEAGATTLDLLGNGGDGGDGGYAGKLGGGNAGNGSLSGAGGGGGAGVGRIRIRGVSAREVHEKATLTPPAAS